MTKHFHIVPHHNNLTEVYSINIRESKIEVLTDEICKVFPFIKNFNVPSVGLTLIEQGTFERCDKMTSVVLRSNFLKSLPLGLFDRNKDLTKVDFSSNLLYHLPSNLFKNTPQLEKLDLNNNQLTSLLFLKEMPVLENVSVIRFAKNRVSVVNVTHLLEKCPNLKEVDFKDNNLLCALKDNTTEAFTLKNIESDAVGKCIEDEVMWVMRQSLYDVENKYESIQDWNQKQESRVFDLQNQNLRYFIGLTTTLVVIVVVNWICWMKLRMSMTKNDKPNVRSEVIYINRNEERYPPIVSNQRTNPIVQDNEYCVSSDNADYDRLQFN